MLRFTSVLISTRDYEARYGIDSETFKPLSELVIKPPVVGAKVISTRYLESSISATATMLIVTWDCPDPKPQEPSVREPNKPWSDKEI